jgi:hypothetical protein
MSNVFHFDPNKHVPVTQEVPKEELGDGDFRRPDIPVPSAFARGAVVIHRRTKARAAVHRVDLVTRQMRLWYPDRAHLPNDEQFDNRTGWQTIDGDWEPEITFSPEEVERQTAQAAFERECEAFDNDELEFVLQFCDDPDPRRKLAKLKAMQRKGLVNASAPVADADAGPTLPEEAPRKGGWPKGKPRKPVEGGEEGA